MSGAAVRKRLKHLPSDLVPVIRRMSPRTIKKARLSNRPDQQEVESPKAKRKSRALRTPALSSPSRKRRVRPRKTQSDAVHRDSVPYPSGVESLAEPQPLRLSVQETSKLDRCTPESVQGDQDTRINVSSVASPNIRISQSLTTESCCNGGNDIIDSPEEAYPLPRTAKQKEKSQLARQKQLEDMRTREATAAREERFQRRKGVWIPPCKKNDACRKKITWKEDAELTDLYVYSPSRESSAGPSV